MEGCNEGGNPPGRRASRLAERALPESLFIDRSAGLAPLTSRAYPAATVMPYRRAGEGPGTWRLGVLDADGACIEESLVFHRRPNGAPRQMGFPAPPEPPRATRAGTAIYLGPLMEHFGHFLLESLSRVWYAKRHPELPVVWSRRVGPGTARGTAGAAAGGDPLTRWQRDILATLGLANPAIFVEVPTRFETLIVPELGNHFQHSFHPELADALATVPHAPVPGRRLWLSRSKLPERLGNLSMPEVEARLAALGWTIVYPETLSFPEQVAAFAAAERIAGEQGSAFHSVLFLKDPQALRLDVFLGDPERPKSQRDKNYDLIAAVKGIDQRMHAMASEVVTRRGKGFRVEKHSTDIGEYFAKLGIDGKAPESMAPKHAFPTAAFGRPSDRSGPGQSGPGQRRPGQSGPQRRARNTAERIARLCAIRPAARYLEIGVSKGETFLAVDIATKHAVDPHFRFDTRPHATDGVRFFPTTSDAYFTGSGPAGVTFDIVFLDGLHTFEQTFRDFCASMAHAHDDTIWIIDDVFPSDVFSALPSQEAAYAYRQMHGRGSRVWHGDVYKAVFAIHDFFPNMSFRTFAPGSDNPQTVLVRRPRPDFRPRFDGLETISRLDYYGFWENRELLSPLPEDEVFDWVARALKRR